MEERKIFRSTSDYIIAGICGGLAKYFKIDSSIIRIIFVLLVLSGGCGVLIYLVLWMIIPKEKEEVKNKEKIMTKEIIDDKKVSTKSRRRGISILGVALILLGGVSIWNRFALIQIDWDLVWSGLLVVVGILLVLR